MKKKNICYLVGNAHLDPVWQWRWQEGSAEAKATVRSALDRMNEFPEFRFVCSSASVYRWIEEFAPEMFGEIKKRINEGRWTVVGGWYVQPDCNLPSGEGFARQSLYSQRWFREKLGVTAKVGYNVDSFGHNANLPQILKKSGMDSYIFMRPAPHEKEMESDIFKWIAPDGSDVMTYRILDPYCFNFDSSEKLENRFDFLDEATASDIPFMPFFYGVGNHGGGPTVKNLELLRDYASRHPKKRLIYSDLSDFFTAVKDSGYPIPDYRGDLQHHAAGCYSTVFAVKSGIRRAETELISAEMFERMACALGSQKDSRSQLAEAWQNVCFCHFHDSMDGCSIREVYDDAALMLGYARNIAAVTENNALQTLSWRINTENKEKGLPVVLFNSHPFPVRETVQINRACRSVADSSGKNIPCQPVHSSTYECTWRNDTLFEADVPALGYAVYYIKDEEPSNQTESKVRAEKWNGVHTANEYGGTVLENEFVSIRFEEYSGYITSFTDKRTGKERITGRAAVPVVIDEYYHDTWSHGKTFFSDEMARFSDAKITIIENGPVRACVRVDSRYNDSELTQYFSLTNDSDALSVRVSVDWHEKHKMLKIAFPMAVAEPTAFYEIPFGVTERPADGEEEPGLRWTMVKGKESGYALINDSTYSSCVRGGTLYLTALRSPIYGDHGGPRTSESEYTDQGQINFKYELISTGNDFASVKKRADSLNAPVSAIVETWHHGDLPDTFGTLSVDCDNVIVSALKRSEDGQGTVIRLYETDGHNTGVKISGAALPLPLCTDIGAFSVDTYYLEDGGREWKKVLMTEYTIEE